MPGCCCCRYLLLLVVAQNIRIRRDVEVVTLARPHLLPHRLAWRLDPSSLELPRLRSASRICPFCLSISKNFWTWTRSLGTRATRAAPLCNFLSLKLIQWCICLPWPRDSSRNGAGNNVEFRVDGDQNALLVILLTFAVQGHPVRWAAREAVLP